jgi:alpha-glucosidase (family GH31 glycosyl hydrolase)
MKRIRVIMVLMIAMLIFLACSSPDNTAKIYRHPVPETIDTNLILPPAWAFGVLYGAYTNQERTIQRIKEIQSHNYPIDAYWIDSWFWSFNDKGRGPKKYIDFVADTVAFPDRTKMWDFMGKNDIKGGFWTWDCILKTGNEKAFEDFKSRGFFSKVYDETNTWHNNSFSTAMFQNNKDQKKATTCGNIDFDNPKAVSYFKTKMKHFFDEGADFIKLDRTAIISVCKAMFEMSQEFGKETKGRGFMLSHSFETDNDAYKRYPAKWTDDTRSDWTIEKPVVKFAEWVPPVAFKENIAMFTDPSKPSSKIPFLTNDLGGYTVGNVQMPDEELYIRWLQFSMFNPITEDFSEPENITSNLAWKYSERADTIFRFYSHLRMQLFPYLYTCAFQSRLEGINMVRKIKGQLYEYMLGNELLVAPVYEKGADSQKIFLPEGNWINYWSGELLEGNAEHKVSAPINQIPVFIKQGSVIPMRNYASSIEKGNNDTLILHFYPGEKDSYTLIEDDGKSNDYLKGIYASSKIECLQTDAKITIVINPARGTYNGMKEYRTWKLEIHQMDNPAQISAENQKTISSYDKKLKVLTIALNALKKELVTINIQLLSRPATVYK